MGAFLMKKVDYIIVGQGLAGTCLAFQLRRQNKSVLIIDKYRDTTSSKVALGVYNPMVLKRFTPVWKVHEQLGPLYNFLDAFESIFNQTIHTRLKLLRKLNSVYEQNLWSEKSLQHGLISFMNPTLIEYDHSDINSDFGFGEIRSAGKVDLSQMISLFREKLISEEMFLDEEFNYSSLIIENNCVVYNSYQASKIVFCEGSRLPKNPFFNYLPLVRTKGELLTVELKNLKVKDLLKSSITLLPLGNDIYKVGATFNWEQKDEICSESAKEELLDKLYDLVRISPKLISHQAGLRPTVTDRRALLGSHSQYPHVYIFNGLGTRGLLLAPYLSLQLIQYMESGYSLDSEVDIKRFQN